MANGYEQTVRRDPVAAAEFVAALTHSGWVNRHLIGSAAGRALHALGLDPRELPRRRFERRARRDLADFFRRGGRLALPAAETPAVSVVVVLFNQAHLTFRCLESLAAQTTGSFEVILADNASTDATPALLAALDGPRIMRNAENLGFLHAANAAAATARGGILLFLNNDAVLHPEAIARAVDDFARQPRTGALGGRMVYPYGRLQGAGCLIDAEGRSRSIGGGDPADDPAHLTGRDVAYCSGSALFVRAPLFAELGGFDARYAPAYYEETDLCFRLHEAGHAVRFEPDIVAMHLVAASAPSLNWVNDLIERNRLLFVERHAARLGGSAAQEATSSGSRR